MAAEQSAGLHLGLEHVVAKCDLTWQRSRLIQPPDLLAKVTGGKCIIRKEEQHTLRDKYKNKTNV